jgi:protein ImuB
VPAIRAPYGIRRLRHPIPARVTLENGRPVRVVTDRRGWSGGRVVWSAGPWRSSGDWWTSDPWNHQEWHVALADGAVYRIHEDRLRPLDAAQPRSEPQRRAAHWFLEAILD